MNRDLMALSDCETDETEYWYNVSSQFELPLAAAKVKPELAKKLDSIASACNSGKHSLSALIQRTLLEEPDSLHELRGLVSIPDKRLYLDLSYIFSRTKSSGRGSLCGCFASALIRHQTSYFINILKKDNADANIASRVITEYLMMKGLQAILEAYSEMSATQRAAVMRCLIIPKEMQQIDAKLRGHGPEAKLAELIEFLGCSFLPEGKAKNPMASHDPNINHTTFEVEARDAEATFSSDMVVLQPKTKLVRICIVGLVHSSDPGQFGVDKARTVQYIRSKIDIFNEQNKGRDIEIWGLVDGVGYSENKNGTLNAMLPHFHCFVQLKTLWKAALRLHQLELARIRAIEFNPSFYSANHVAQFERYIPQDVQVVTRIDDRPTNCEIFSAGNAKIYK